MEVLRNAILLEIGVKYIKQQIVNDAIVTFKYFIVFLNTF